MRSCHIFALELALFPGWFLPDLRRAAVNPVADAPSLAIPSDAILTFIFSTWVAARIYRVGILMYGKKVTLRELAKWFNQK